MTFLPYVQPASEIPPWPPTGEIPTPECRACGWVRTDPTEPDGCLGWIPQVHNVCCGHGRLYLKDGQLVQSTELWLDWVLALGQVGHGLIFKGGPITHEALEAWRQGDTERFWYVVATLVGQLFFDRVTSQVPVEAVA